MNSRTIALSVLLLLMILPGCWDLREPENLSYISMIGIDKGEGDNYLFHFVISSLIPPGGGVGDAGGGDGTGGGETTSPQVLSIEASNVQEAIWLSRRLHPKELTAIQYQAIVFGREVAEAGLSDLVDSLSRDRELLRFQNHVYIADGKSGDILRSQPPMNVPLPRVFFNIVNEFRLGRVNRYINLMSSLEVYGMDAVFPLISASPPPKTRSEDAGIHLAGLAAFRRDRMVGVIEFPDIITFSLVRGIVSRYRLHLQDPDTEVRIRLERTPVPVLDLDAEPPKIHIPLQVDIDVLSTRENIDYTLRENQTRLAEKVSADLEKRILGLVGKAQTEFKADVFNFSRFVRREFATWGDWMEYRWEDKFQEVRFSVKVDGRVRRTGMITSPPG